MFGVVLAQQFRNLDPFPHLKFEEFEAIRRSGLPSVRHSLSIAQCARREGGRGSRKRRSFHSHTHTQTRIIFVREFRVVSRHGIILFEDNSERIRAMQFSPHFIPS